MATLYEGLKWFRVNLQTWADQANRERAIPLKKVNGKDAEDALIQKEASSNGGHLGSDQVYSPTVESSDRTVRSYRSILSLFNSNNPSPFSPFRLLQTGIYCVQLTLAYWLMLVAMTYNTYLTAAVVLGAGFGHWLFAILKRVPSTADRVDAFASDACH
ncbi:Protein F27C1.2 b [Aphelenchoides avenae]|nr:Protein F27C1.2 b [Aphelenchus avenae]